MESLVDEIPADPLFLLFGDFERGSPLQKLVLLGLAAKVGEIPLSTFFSPSSCGTAQSCRR